MLETLQPWELMLKKIVWKQLGDLHGLRILDFGSGLGINADHYAHDNDVVAIEPSESSVSARWSNNKYQQYCGSTNILQQLPSNSFDMILCHNVLEYAPDREEIVKEFCRVLKPDGKLSVVKHNRAGRVMQMVVLLNEFERADNLLSGKDDVASKYGSIRYFEDLDITRWCTDFSIQKVYGIRTFWDLQQNQESHIDPQWQEKMIAIEQRVSEIDAYRNIAFFHHLILKK